MTSRDFAYWMQGFFEISGSSELSKDQVELIKKHLNMVFYHEIDKSFGKDQAPLTQIHELGLPKLDKWDFGPKINC